VSPDSEWSGGPRSFSEEEFERVVEARVRQREQEHVTESLRKSYEALQARIDQMNQQVQDRLHELRDEVVSQTRAMQERYEAVHAEMEERRRVLRLPDLSLPQMAKFPDLMRFWDLTEDDLRQVTTFWHTYRAILPVIAQRYTARSITAEQHEEREAKFGKRVAVFGGVPTAVLATGTLFVWIWEQLAHHWR
jgi:uncharacterized protein YPO0396